MYYFQKSLCHPGVTYKRLQEFQKYVTTTDHKSSKYMLPQPTTRVPKICYHNRPQEFQNILPVNWPSTIIVLLLYYKNLKDKNKDRGIYVLLLEKDT